MDDKNVNEIMEKKATNSKKILFDYLKEKKLADDKELIEKISHAIQRNGDFQFKNGMKYISNLITESLNNTLNLEIFKQIPYISTVVINGRLSKVLYSAYTKELKVEQAKEIQSYEGYPDYSCGFYEFKNNLNEYFTWYCDYNLGD